MLLLGHPQGTPLFTAGAVPIASARLLASRKPGGKPLPTGEAEETVAALRRTAAEAMDRLRERRKEARDPGPDRRRAMEAAAADTSPELRQMHRYERWTERSLRWALRQLMALAKSGADLRDGPETEPERAPEAVVSASGGEGAPEKHDVNDDDEKSCDKLASVGTEALLVARPGVSAGASGGQSGPSEAEPNPNPAPRRR